jgi:hypothetical protein
MHLAKTLCLASLLALASAAATNAATIVEEHVPGGDTQLVWLTGFNTNRMLIGGVLDPSNPAYANPSGDHTVGVLTTAITDSGGIALSCTDPQGQADYTWDGWMFTGDGNSRRGLILRADPTNNFQSSYQFVLYAGMAQLSFRKLINQTPTPLRSWIGPQIPGGIPAVNTWHHLKVEAIANGFRCWWDDVELTAGNPIIDASSPLLTGFVGTYNFRFDISNITAYFDDLVLTTETPVPARTTSWGTLKAAYR